jgi:ferredoxin
MREFFGALGEIVIDEEGQRVLPEVNEERCSGCGSCKDSCPQSAIEITYRETPLSIFGTRSASQVPIARIKEDSCVRCGLCVSTCPSDVIIYNDHYIPEACDTAKVLHTEN